MYIKQHWWSSVFLKLLYRPKTSVQSPFLIFVFFLFDRCVLEMFENDCDLITRYNTVTYFSACTMHDSTYIMDITYNSKYWQNNIMVGNHFLWLILKVQNTRRRQDNNKVDGNTCIWHLPGQDSNGPFVMEKYIVSLLRFTNLP
jgi:hypothetical protein